jgi:CBS domain containing-hemolysin-like protein
LLLLRLVCELTATTLVALVVIGAVSTSWVAATVTAGTMAVVSFVVVRVGRVRSAASTRTRWAARRSMVLGLGRALGPLASLLIRSAAFTPRKGFRESPFATQVELRELVDLAEQRGVVEHDERDMIHSVFALGDTIAREVMVPRTEMVFIELV